MCMRRALALSAVLLTASVFAQVPQTPIETPGAAPPVIKTETRVVLVDAVVTGKNGKYLRDLTAKEFHVFEDDKEQRVTSFSFEGNSAPSSDRKHYLVLFFDNSTMQAADQVQARKAATQFIGANAGPDHLIAIADFSGSLRIRQNFTDDVALLKQVAGGSQPSVATARPTPAGRGPQLAGLDNGYGQFSPILALRDLARNLAPVAGRKTLVVLTAGFPETSSNLPELNALVDASNKANVAVYPVDVRGIIAGNRATDSSQGLNDPAPSRRRASVPDLSVLSLDTSVETAGAPARVNQQFLDTMARGTGGFVILNTNDFSAGMSKVADEQREYYLLGYTAPPLPGTGCHRLKVKVDRSGSSVRARSGYCDVKPRDVLAGKPIERDLETRASSAQKGDAGASIKLPFFYTATNQARVDMTLEIPTDGINFEKDKGKFHAVVNVLGLAYPAAAQAGLERVAVARFSDSQDLVLNDQKEVDAFKSGKRFRYEYQFNIASGQYELNVAFNSGAQSFGTAVSPLAIDSWDGKMLNLSGIALSSDIHPIGQGGGELEAALRDDRKVLVCRGLQVVPSGSNHFRADEKAGAYIEIYAPRLLEPNPPAIVAALRIFDTKSGEKKIDSGFFNVADSIQSGNPVIPLLLAIPNSLAPGSYTLEVSTGEADGAASLTRRATFEIEVASAKP
jgi:VWFA-related protein